MRTLGLYLRVFAIAVALNFVWEMMQARLYAPMGTFWHATWRCFLASLGDGVIIVAICIVGAALFRSPVWFASLTRSRFLFTAIAACAVALAIEWWALRTGVGVQRAHAVGAWHKIRRGATRTDDPARTHNSLDRVTAPKAICRWLIRGTYELPDVSRLDDGRRHGAWRRHRPPCHCSARAFDCEAGALVN